MAEKKNTKTSKSQYYIILFAYEKIVKNVISIIKHRRFIKKNTR